MFSARSALFFSRTENQVALASFVSAATFLMQWHLHQDQLGNHHHHGSNHNNGHVTFCDAEPKNAGPTNAAGGKKTNPEFSSQDMAEFGPNSSGFADGANSGGLDNTTMFYGQCLARQLRRPKIPYPAWDYDWDHRETEATSQEALSGQSQFNKSKSLGKTRHLILIRHGQYDERYKDDRRRKLTPLGRHQAELTGQRLAVLARGGLQGGPQLSPAKKDHVVGAGPLYIKSIHVSDMERAKETARIIHSHIPHVKLNDPDPMLNEALPAPMIPIRPDIRAVREIDANHNRVEAAFQKYFHRADPNDHHNDHPHHPHAGSSSSSENPQHSMEQNTDVESPDQDHSGAGGEHHPHHNVPSNPKHEFEIIVAHGNIIRFFFCRALQLPPEAWLRISTFNCSMTYIMIYPNGYVSCRMLGDVGHLGYDNTSFSGSHGYNW
ncbi:hypothetical protein ACA910_002896 [Epithemia clementina (nom. ined.)]